MIQALTKDNLVMEEGTLQLQEIVNSIGAMQGLIALDFEVALEMAPTEEEFTRLLQLPWHVRFTESHSGKWELSMRYPWQRIPPELLTRYLEWRNDVLKHIRADVEGKNLEVPAELATADAEGGDSNGST